jgi:hypothetical protein
VFLKIEFLNHQPESNVNKYFLILIVTLSAHTGFAQAGSMSDKLKQVEDSQAEMRRKMGMNPPTPSSGNSSTPSSSSTPAYKYDTDGSVTSGKGSAPTQSSSAKMAIKSGGVSFSMVGCMRLQNLATSVSCSFIAENTSAKRTTFQVRDIVLTSADQLVVHNPPPASKSHLALNANEQRQFSVDVLTGFALNQVKSFKIVKQGGAVEFKNIAIN